MFGLVVGNVYNVITYTHGRKQGYLGGGILLGTGALSYVLMGLLHRPGRFC